MIPARYWAILGAIVTGCFIVITIAIGHDSGWW